MSRRLSVVALLTCSFIALAEDLQLETYARMRQGPGNITLTPDGRVIVSLHQFYETPLRVVEVARDGSLKPFPNDEWNTPGAGGRPTLDAVLGVQCDANGVVWMLDNGLRGKVAPKLVGWNTKANALERVIYLPPPITVEGSFVNDLAVDAARNVAFVADPAGPRSALIVVDLRTGDARRVLEGHPSVTPEDIDIVIGGRPIEMMGPEGRPVRPRVGVNPIALDAKNEWLYFGPMNGRTMWRVKAADVLDAGLPVAALFQRVERYAERPISDGISIDVAGNIYISDITANALGVITPERQYRTLVKDDALIAWPDAFSFGPDGMLYVVLNQLHKSPPLNGGQNETELPFRLMRLKPLAAGVVGR